MDRNNALKLDKLKCCYLRVKTGLGSIVQINAKI